MFMLNVFFVLLVGIGIDESIANIFEQRARQSKNITCTV